MTGEGKRIRVTDNWLGGRVNSDRGDRSRDVKSHRFNVSVMKEWHNDKNIEEVDETLKSRPLLKTREKEDKDPSYHTPILDRTEKEDENVVWRSVRATKIVKNMAKHMIANDTLLTKKFRDDEQEMV